MSRPVIPAKAEIQRARLRRTSTQAPDPRVRGDDQEPEMVR
jgi:hypothetical protein